MKPSYELFDTNTQAIIFGMQTNAIQRMLDFDGVCGRATPSIACIVNPTKKGLHKAFFGKNEILIPMYKTLADAATFHPNADVLVNFASYRSAFAVSREALAIQTINTLIVIAEGIPERQARILLKEATDTGKVVIGPATVGGIKAGAFKVGNTGGMIDNIVTAKLHRPGSVGFVSKSGGLSNEAYNIIGQNTDGLNEGIAIGGDAYPSSTFVDHLLRYEANPAIKFMVVLGEVGGLDEYAIIDALQEGKITKPVVSWVTGTCAKVFPSEVQFGHAGAKASSDRESADAKNTALREAGAIVPNSFDDFGEKIKETYQSLVASGKLIPAPDVPAQLPPEDFAKAVKEGKVRKATNFICTISDERGEELKYNNELISDIIQGNKGIGYTIGSLWFKKSLPEFATKFIEMVIVITADHGPAVSGAHNSIVAARAGKDMVSALCSGLLTIGPRFGGALNDAALFFKDAVDKGISPKQFIDDMKTKGINIPGIGHRIKSVQNPDKRVELVKEFAVQNFSKRKYLAYALEVEKITTSKKNTLILNVDGAIAVCFLDMMASISEFTTEEIEAVAKGGMLNALFVFGRSIGFIGHIFDQYRLKAGLYRHPWDDILYM